MTNPTIPQTVRFPDLFDKPLVATFDREQASSDGGAVLLKAAEWVYGLVKAFARCLVDKRAPEKVRHTLEDLVGQRVFGIACGHPDGNDADHLADDPIHKLLLGRDPVAGGRLVSQPTISRFENDAGRSALYRMGRELAASVIERHQSAPDAALYLRENLLCPRRYREPHQGAARRSADRPYELLQVLGEPVARLPDGRRLRAHAGTRLQWRWNRCTAPGFLDTSLGYAAWRSSYSSRASSGVR